MPRHKTTSTLAQENHYGIPLFDQLVLQDAIFAFVWGKVAFLFEVDWEQFIN